MDNAAILHILVLTAYMLVWAFGILLSFSESFVLGCIATFFNWFGFAIGLVYMVFGVDLAEEIAEAMCPTKS